MATKMRSEKFQGPAPIINNATAHKPPLPTFLDHVRELRRRLFWVVATVLIAASVAYCFLNQILAVLTQPLGSTRLFYLTPAGGLSFSIKVCTYLGILMAVPVIMFHIYRFLEPLMGNARKPALFYVGFSSLLAISGVLFAYFISLPGALHFLTNFNGQHIQAMLTADSYLSFVMTYLLGAALLFQIPLLLLIINTMTPLKPSKLMKSQRFVIIGAFLLGAIISPTPDIMNQTLLALPIIGMFQFGVGLVWLQNRARARKTARVQTNVPAQNNHPREQLLPADVLKEIARPPAAMAAAPTRIVPPQAANRLQTAPKGAAKRNLYSDIVPRAAQPLPQRVRLAAPRSPARDRQQVRPATKLAVPNRSIDGFKPYRASTAV